jgi:gliding motility-associatede transport system auxiliary component
MDLIPVPTRFVTRVLQTSLSIFGVATIAGILALVLGERGFYHSDSARQIFDIVGVALLVGVGGMRVMNVVASDGDRRRAERIPLLCHLGLLVAVVVYFLTTKTGMGWLGYADLTSKSADKTQTILMVVWAILGLVSVIPLLMSDFAMGVRRFEGGGSSAEYVRTRESAVSGVSIALAAAFLVVTCNVASERNIRRDVSYFKTSQAGDSTVNIVKNSSKPVRALLFFPEVNEVKTEIKAYLDDLASQTGGKITVEVHDRQTEPKLAAHYKVTKDGTVVLTNATAEDDKVEKTDKPPKTELFDFDPDIEKARRGKSKLRNLDREVNSHLLKLMREKLKVYITVGHGEMNDPDSISPELRGSVPPRGTSVLKRVLGLDQYEIHDLGYVQLSQAVPEDAAVVMVLAPSQALRPEELDALDKYLVKGGHVLIALDPRGSGELGVLEGRLGVSFEKGILSDDKLFVNRGHGPADHRFTATTQFSAHASTTSLSRAAANVGVLLIEAGALKEHPFTSEGDPPKRTFVMHSMTSSWLDLDGNYTLDGNEKRDRYPIAAAIEGPKLGTGDDGKDKDGWKALVFADGDLFADYPPGQAMDLTSGPLIEDATKWLAGEAILTGQIVSEDDVPIQHTRSQDQIWFYLTIVGAPLLVLGVGLVLTMSRRRRTVTAKVPS